VGEAVHANSNQLRPLQAGVAFLADDDVVVHGNAERICLRDDLRHHLDVGARWETSTIVPYGQGQGPTIWDGK
jgi:hypothetical protein